MASHSLASDWKADTRDTREQVDFWTEGCRDGATDGVGSGSSRV